MRPSASRCRGLDRAMVMARLGKRSNNNVMLCQHDSGVALAFPGRGKVGIHAVARPSLVCAAASRRMPWAGSPISQ